MPCYNPITGFRAPGGRVVFSRSKGWRDRPVTVPCGQCVGCRLDRSRAWATRCVHEAHFHERNSFVTLTYDQDHVPRDGGLVLKHWQDFAKRVRKRIGKFRFLHCGEYGEENARPHYHACVFGQDFRPWTLWSKEKNHSVYRSEVLDDLWGMGMTTVGDLNWQSAAYVARYVMKKRTGPLAEEEYRRIDLETGEEYFVKPPYITMSRGARKGVGGLGSEWIKKYREDVYPDDFVVLPGGKKSKPPKFYDRHLESEDPETFEEIVRGRKKRAAARASDNTGERLDVKRSIKEGQLKLLKRRV